MRYRSVTVTIAVEVFDPKMGSHIEYRSHTVDVYAGSNSEACVNGIKQVSCMRQGLVKRAHCNG